MKKAAALVRVFSHSAVNNDALRLSQRSLNEKENKQLKEVQCDAEDMDEEPREEKLDDSGKDADVETLNPSSCQQETTSPGGRKPLDVLNRVRQQDTRLRGFIFEEFS